MQTVTLAASAARTAAGQSGVLTFEKRESELSVLLDVTAVSGLGPKLDVTIEWSHDGAKWFGAEPVDNFAQITAAKSVVKTFPARGLYARVSWVITDTITFAVHAHVN